MTTKVLEKTETEQLFADLDKPSLHSLSYALRHPDTWPDGFYWNFGNCGHCAMGLAHALWQGVPATDTNHGATDMARAFHMPYDEAKSIFLGGDWVPHTTINIFWWRRYLCNFRAVTPDMVAAQIDKYLAKCE